MISIGSPILQTWIFSIILFCAIIATLRFKKSKALFSLEVSTSLKGVAILAVIFSHVGYFLFTDNRFLYPLSTLAGVGVNLFLLLSGYGLTISSLRKQDSLLHVYWHRLKKIFIPLWLVLIVFFTADKLFLGNNFSWGYIVRSFLGFFPTADIYGDINSALWYITLIVFYYLLFPLIFSRKRPWLSAIIIYLVSYIIVHQDFGAIGQIVHMYKIHLLAFPLGMIVANLFIKGDYWKKLFAKIPERARKLFYYPLITILVAVALYFSANAFIGIERYEEWASLAVVIAITILFILFKMESRFLYWCGHYSYEIYLLHWPMMYHYDFLFKLLPAGLAMALYLPFLLGLGYLLHLLVGLINREKTVKLK